MLEIHRSSRGFLVAKKLCLQPVASELKFLQDVPETTKCLRRTEDGAQRETIVKEREINDCNKTEKRRGRRISGEKTRYLLKCVLKQLLKLKRGTAVVSGVENVILPLWTQKGNFESTD